MPSSDFSFETTVVSSPERCWAKLTDVATLISWITILEDAREIDPLKRYSAVLMDRIGLFKLRADLDITVDEVHERDGLRVHAQGEDRQVSSRIVVDAQLSMREEIDGTRVAIAGTYEVTGKVATMGTGTIRKKADKLIKEFFGHVEAELGDGA